MTDDTPAAIARRLTEAQRDAMDWMHRQDGSAPGWTIGAATVDLSLLGLCAFGSLTPLGAAVRAELEKESKA
jgi:hypothetical protein